MGNRGGIEVLSGVRADGGVAKVCIYSHWEGCFVAEFVRRTLGWSRDRWNDPGHLARFIAFDIAEGSPKNSLVVAIAPELAGIRHRVAVVDVPHQTVRFENPEDRSDVSGEWPFAEYLQLPREELDRAYHRDFGGELTRDGVAELRRRLRWISRPTKDSRLERWPGRQEPLDLFSWEKRLKRKAPAGTRS